MVVPSTPQKTRFLKKNTCPNVNLIDMAGAEMSWNCFETSIKITKCSLPCGSCIRITVLIKIGNLELDMPASQSSHVYLLSLVSCFFFSGSRSLLCQSLCVMWFYPIAFHYICLLYAWIFSYLSEQSMPLPFPLGLSPLHSRTVDWETASPESFWCMWSFLNQFLEVFLPVCAIISLVTNILVFKDYLLYEMA